MKKRTPNTETYFEEVGFLSRGSHLFAYISGFALSLVFTDEAYWLATHGSLSGVTLVVVLALFALMQVAVQLVCFLHLSEHRASRARLFVFGGTMLVVAILVGGSIWVMFHLNQRMMGDPAQMQEYMNDQTGI